MFRQNYTNFQNRHTPLDCFQLLEFDMIGRIMGSKVDTLQVYTACTDDNIFGNKTDELKGTNL